MCASPTLFSPMTTQTLDVWAFLQRKENICFLYILHCIIIIILHSFLLSTEIYRFSNGLSYDISNFWSPPLCNWHSTLRTGQLRTERTWKQNYEVTPKSMASRLTHTHDAVMQSYLQCYCLVCVSFCGEKNKCLRSLIKCHLHMGKNIFGRLLSIFRAANLLGHLLIFLPLAPSFHCQTAIHCIL